MSPLPACAPLPSHPLYTKLDSHCCPSPIDCARSLQHLCHQRHALLAALSAMLCVSQGTCNASGEGKDALDPTWSNYRLRNWNNTTYPCDGNVSIWAGVSCSNGLVTALFLGECGLDGSLPPTWGTLPGLEGLRDLDVQANRLKGTLPGGWGGLTGLRTLYARRNRLTGSIPESWGNLTGLQALHLDSNQLTGTLPASLGGVKALQNLLLGENSLKGPLPASWGNLTGLLLLDLAKNTQLTGTLPASWGSMTVLMHLALSNATGITGTIPCTWSSMGSNATNDWTGQPGMAQVMLGGTGLSGCYPSAVLRQAGDKADLSWSYMYGSNPLSGVRGECCPRLGEGAACIKAPACFATISAVTQCHHTDCVRWAAFMC
jgi:hypothetical protein